MSDRVMAVLSVVDDVLTVTCLSRGSKLVPAFQGVICMEEGEAGGEEKWMNEEVMEIMAGGEDVFGTTCVQMASTGMRMEHEETRR